MSILNSIGKEIRPTLRLEGWRTLGAQTRPTDTRTTEQLLANIEYYAQKNPEVAQLKKELKSVNPKHLGLVSDICELANDKDLLEPFINLKKLKMNDGKSLFSWILEKLPKASKENPKAMEFTQEVINHTDTIASKYFLADFRGILDFPAVSKQLDATKPLIKDIAEETLGGGLRLDFEKERHFMDTIRTFVAPSAKPEKISMLKEIWKPVDALPDRDMMHIDRFVRSDAPASQIRANIPQLKRASDVAHAQGQYLDIDEFLTTNANFAKAPQKVDIVAIKAGDIKLG